VGGTLGPAMAPTASDDDTPNVKHTILVSVE
jgi:hypothetical protein